MKKVLQILTVLVAMCSFAFAQTAGDFRSKATGNWGDATTWETFNGEDWEDAVGTPSLTSGTTTITGGHTVTIASAITVNGATIVVNGYFLESSAVTKTSGSWTFNNGSTFELAHAPASNQGVPTATWNTGSTCIVTGVTGSTSGLNVNQDFYHFTWNCASLSSGSLNWGWTTRTINGNLTVTNSNSMQIRLGAGGGGEVTVKGNVNINGSGALLSFAGGGTAATLTVEGDLNITAGQLSMSNASGMVGTLNLYGDFNLSSGATFGKSNGANLSKLYFKKAGIQTVTIGASATLSNAPNFQVESGSILNMGTSVFGGTGSFTVNSGGTIQIGHANGLNGNVTTTGANGGGNSFNTAANYTYNGSASQVTGSRLPATVNNLTIDNSEDVFNSQEVTVNGVLHLAAGNFDNSVNQVTLAEGASVNNTGGSISEPALPVELVSFSALVRGKNVELQWNTATEINNAGFEIERSAERSRSTTAGVSTPLNAQWDKVGFVEGNGTTNAPKEYSFVDAVQSGATYQYRLKQIDRDGKFEYSPVVEATVALSAQDFHLTQNYPNPFNPSTTFNFAMKNAELTTVKVYNLVGQEVAVLFNEIAQPNQLYTMKFDAKNLPSGIYFYSLRSASRSEVRKMMLIK